MHEFAGGGVEHAILLGLFKLLDEAVVEAVDVHQPQGFLMAVNLAFDGDFPEFFPGAGATGQGLRRAR